LTRAPAFLLTVASAGLYALAFPPLRARWLAWVALVPLLLALRDASWRRRIALGVVWSLAVGWGLGTWMPSAVSDYFHQPLWVGAGLFLLVTGAMAAPYYVAFAVAFGPLARRFGVVAPFLVGAAWAGVELARGRLLNGTLLYVGNSPWGTFGYSQAGVAPLIQLASVTGVYGLSFLLVSVNAATAEIVGAVARRRRVERSALVGWSLALAMVVCVVAFGTLVLRSAEHAPGGVAPVRIALAQGNVGAAARWGSEGPARTLDTYVRLTAAAFERGRPEIVFWPEAALTFFLEQDDVYRRALGVAVRDGGAELVIGAPRAVGADGSAPYTNSVYLVAPDGTLAARYDKRYLLPFMEYFPLRVELARRRFGRIREFTPGEPSPPLPTRAGRAGILICNEALLPHVAALRMAEGAAYLVNPSNDSWVPHAGFAWQQFDIAALRAVEQRTYLVRVSDSGPSAVIDPFGGIVAHTEPLTRDVLLASIVPTESRSVYGAVGDLFGSACLLIAAVALLVSSVSRYG
jgi:apolipoprotein N-acyltransferase